MKVFEFATAGRLLFGNGAVSRVPSIASAWGTRTLLVRGTSPSRSAVLESALNAAGVECAHFAVTSEPTVETAEAGSRALQEARCDLVIAIGGGSVLDAGKAIAALATNGGNPLDFMEVVGRGLSIDNPPLPFIAVPTTAGTGTEVTRNVVLLSKEHGVKASMRSPLLLPRLAVVDPELTYDCPPRVTAAAGMDALTQLIEPFLSVNANPLTDALALEGIGRVARSLRRAYRDGRDSEAREDMALAALMSGMCLANAGLGVVHGIAAPLGGLLGAPHGAVCARLLPFVMRVNLLALQDRDPESPALTRMARVAQVVTGQEHATVTQGLTWIADLGEELQIPALGSYGLSKSAIPSLVEQTMLASSTRGNPIVLEAGEITAAIEAAL
jgi:alcohol dehydrogenase class IV